MKVVAHFVGTDDLELELSIRMPLKHWKELKATLGSNWPAWDLGRHIGDAVHRAERQVWADPPDETEAQR